MEMDNAMNADTSSAVAADEEHGDDRRHSFKIITQKREFQFATDSAKDLERWFRAFHSTHNPLG